MQNDKKYSVILFDLDGTLTDPKIGITKSAEFALKTFGINVGSLEELNKFIGPPLKDSFKDFYNLSDDEAENAIDQFRVYFKEFGMFENSVYPGIENLLKDLKLNGYILAVATSKPTVFAEKILDHFKLSEYFNIITGSNMDNTRTAKKEIIEYVINKLNLTDKKSIIMIGDRKHDIIGAKLTGIDSVAVKYGYGSEEELKMIQPTYMAESIDDLQKLFIPT